MHAKQYLKQGLWLFRWVVVLLVLSRVGVAAVSGPDTASGVLLDDSFGKLPLHFIENRGQEDPRVAFSVRGRETTLYLTSQGLTFVLSGSAPPSQDARVKKVSSSPGRGVAKGEETRSMGRWVVKLDFVGANPEVKPEGREPMPAAISYFKGPREKWRTGLKTYGSVIYRDLWPGIDLIYTGTVNRLKYSFLVQPGADPERIRLAYRGVSSLSVTDAGQLEVKTPVSAFQDDRPVAYQEVEGRAVEVRTAYALKTDAGEGAWLYGFDVGAYDRSRLLVLDPAVLVYCGYIGGGGGDGGTGIAVDGDGNAYVTGGTRSAEATFPVKVGPDLTHNGGLDDAFVVKVNPSGTALVYCGYIGGSDQDFGEGIAVDGEGNAYVTGTTASTEATFPVTGGLDLTHNGGFNDAFVAKVNPSGTALVYCGYIGGSSYDEGHSIAVDSDGNAYVTGETGSSGASFPVAGGPDLSFNEGGADAFVAKVNAAGTALVYCGYIGGSDDDRGYGIAVDGEGNAYVTGWTASTAATFPVKVGPDLTHNGYADAFVAKVSASGTALAYCGYIGGSGYDYSYGIAVDGDGNAYVTGYTTSTQTTFPVKVGPYLTYNGGNCDAFVAKVSASGTALVYCGYIGGWGEDYSYGIAVDGGGNAYGTGYTSSDEASFPVTGGPDLTFNGYRDAFVAKVNPAGTALVYCGYIGGEGPDVCSGIAVDGGGNAYVTGNTRSREYDSPPFPVIVGPDLTWNGPDWEGDAFVAKVVVGPEPPVKPTGPAPVNGAANVCTNPVLSWSGDGTATSYDVYFGTDSTPDNGEFRGNQTNTQFRPGRLGPNTTYYWRVDAKNQSGTATGDVWSFTTGSKPCMKAMPWIPMLLGD